MATIITKDEFISKYLIGTNNKDVMLFNLNQVAVGVKKHDSYYGRELNLMWSYSSVNILKHKDKIILTAPNHIKDSISSVITMTFPLEIDYNGNIECLCFDGFTNKVLLNIYEKRM
jgi:hypothetical protein